MTLTNEEIRRIDDIIRYNVNAICHHLPARRHHFEDAVSYCWLYAWRQLCGKGYDRNKSKPQTFIRRFVRNWIYAYLKLEGFIPGATKKLETPWRERIYKKRPEEIRWLQ